MADEQKTNDENCNNSIDCSYISGKEIMLHAIEGIERSFKNTDTNVLKTDFKYLEFQRDDLVVLAGRPYIGKTNFVLNLLSQFVLEKKIPVGLVDAKNQEYSIANRILSINSGIPFAMIRSGMLRMDEVSRIQEAAAKFFDSPLYLFNEPNSGLEAIKRNAIHMAMEHHIQLLIVDAFEYIQEIVDTDEKNYRAKLTYLLCAFKSVATQLNIPVILVMEIPETRNNNEPNLSVFKKHMVIPDRADKVIFLHRDRLTNYAMSQNTKLIVAKNSNGSVVDISINYNTVTGKFFCGDASE